MPITHLGIDMCKPMQGQTWRSLLCSLSIVTLPLLPSTRTWSSTLRILPRTKEQAAADVALSQDWFPSCHTTPHTVPLAKILWTRTSTILIYFLSAGSPCHHEHFPQALLPEAPSLAPRQPLASSVTPSPQAAAAVRLFCR